MENTTARKEKTRKIGVYAFFEALQIEYIVADLRLRLYPKQKDKDYWKKVREGKRATIEQIAEKNTLPTIFTDAGMRAEFDSRVFNRQGHPNFNYKDENDRNQQGFFDLLHYYSKDADVRCDINGEMKVGKVVKAFNMVCDRFVTVLINDVEEKVAVGDVTRIL